MYIFRLANQFCDYVCFKQTAPERPAFAKLMIPLILVQDISLNVGKPSFNTVLVTKMTGHTLKQCIPPLTMCALFVS